MKALFEMICQKCSKVFDYLVASCGTGQTWNLYRCPHCGQLHAEAKVNGYIPDEALKDKEIIVITEKI